MNLLQSPGILGRRPLIGVMLIVLGMSLFSLFAINLPPNSPLHPLDMQIVNSLHTTAEQGSRFVLGLMILGFYFGEHGILVIGFGLMLYFIYKRFWLELSMVVLAWLGEGGIWIVFSDYFKRARPTFDVPVWHHITGNGFPSGHSFAAVICFGLLAYLIAPKMPTLARKIAVIAIAALLILYIGFSRIYIGDHYPTDILAGFAIGIAWSGLVFTSLELIFKRNRVRSEVQAPAFEHEAHSLSTESIHS